MLGADPKVGRPPVRLAGSPKTAALPVRPISPEGIRIGRIGVGRPEGRPRPRRIRTPKGKDLTPGKIPRESPVPVRFTRRCSVSGKSHPTPKSRSRPSAQPRRADTSVRVCAGGLAPADARRRPRSRARYTPSVESLDRPKAVEASTCHRRAPSRVAHRTLRRTSRRRRAARRTVTHPKVRSGSWLRPLQQAGVTGLGPDRHRLHRKSRTEIPPGPEGHGAGANAGGAAGTAQPPPKGRLLRSPPMRFRKRSAPIPWRAEARRGRQEPKPSALSPPVRRSVPRTPNQHCWPGDGVERVDFHVKERFRRPFSSW